MIASTYIDDLPRRALESFLIEGSEQFVDRLNDGIDRAPDVRNRFAPRRLVSFADALSTAARGLR